MTTILHKADKVEIRNEGKTTIKYQGQSIDIYKMKIIISRGLTSKLIINLSNRTKIELINL